MVSGWVCDRCERVHTGNPSECRSCGHHVLRPASDADLETRSEGVEAPEPMELDERRTYGSSPTDDTASGPDLNPDGSIKPGTETPSIDDSEPVKPDRTWRIRALVALALLAAALTVGALVVTGAL